MLPVIPRKVVHRLVPTSAQMMLPVIPRKVVWFVVSTYQCTDDVACDPQEGCGWLLWFARTWLVPVHRWCCLWSPGRLWLVPTSAQMMLPVIPRKVVVGYYQYTDDVACDPQEGCGWLLPVHRWCCLWSPGRQWWYLPVHRYLPQLWLVHSTQMMLPVIPRSYQEGCCLWSPGRLWYLPVHRCSCLWSPGRLWLVPTSAQMMLPVIPRKAMIGRTMP